MVCQLRPSGGSLGLNNTPRIGFTLVKSRTKQIPVPRCEQRDSRCKTFRADVHFFCQTLRSCVTAVPWQSEIGTLRSMANGGEYTADCHQENLLTADC
jgi:hypothetical protein